MTVRRLSSFAAGVAVAAGTLLAWSAAYAAETVSVELVGERGGKMSIKLDKPSVPAGEVTFQVTNVAKQTPHEMVVIKLDSKGQKLVVDPETNKVDESKLTDLGEVEGLKAGQSGKLTVNLKPGNYELICNYKGHVMAGMTVPFTVTGSSS